MINKTLSNFKNLLELKQEEISFIDKANLINK